MSSQPKTFWQKVIHEIKSIAGVTFYFAVWLGILMLLKRLMLEDYNIEFRGISIALISALVMAKVVLLMDLIPLGSWIRRQPSVVDVLVRMLLYTVGVLFVFLMEKAFESRHEAGGFGTALSNVFHHRDIYKVWAGTIVVGISLFWFQVWGVISKHLDKGELATLFFRTPLEEVLQEHKAKSE